MGRWSRLLKSNKYHPNIHSTFYILHSTSQSQILLQNTRTGQFSREKVSTRISIFKTGVLLTEDDGRDVYIKTTLRWRAHDQIYIHLQTSQELRMLSSVTINCQLTKIVMNSGSQLSELLSVSQMSQVSRIVFSIVKMVKAIV